MNTKQVTNHRDLTATMLKVQGLKVDYDSRNHCYNVFSPKDLTGGFHVNPHQWVRVSKDDNVISLELFYNWGETGTILSMTNMGLSAYVLEIIIEKMLSGKIGE
jgi:hypothetical protein